MRRILISVNIFLLLSSGLSAQTSRLKEDVAWRLSAEGSAGTGEESPFWFTSNRYGLGHAYQYAGIARASLERDVMNDSLRFWGVGYGMDAAVVFDKEITRPIIQQAYLDVQWKMLRLSLGQKQRHAEFKNPELSTGGLSLGNNARPLPMIRVEMPDFWAIPGTKGFFSIKGHAAFGFYTDNRWQRQFNAGTHFLYTANSKFHSKAGFIRIGNEEKFPLLLSGGLEMACQFGGEAWNMRDRADHGDPNVTYYEKIGNGIMDYWNAFVPGGSDSNDGNYTNIAGNHLGSWHACAEWKEKDWSLSMYYEHYYEDHSQLFLQYAWKDMLLGVEAKLPKNRFLSNIVYEYITMTDQSGAVYHDRTANIPIQISSMDSYYSHHVYGAWQHAGYCMGNPLLLSPLYNDNHRLTPMHTRIKAHHVGATGQPCDELKWRMMYTHEVSRGTYASPTQDPMYGNYYLAEATYMPHCIPGFSVTASYGRNSGELLGKTNAGMLTVSYSGIFNSTK